MVKMINKEVIKNIEKYSFVKKVVENLTSITVYTTNGKRTIPKRIDTKRLLKILNGLKPKESPIVTERELIPIGVVL